MEAIKSKLILNTFDGTMKNININPKYVDSEVEFHISYYDKDDILTKASIIYFSIGI